MRRSALVASLLLLLTGCFEIEQSIKLEKDLSGTADFHLGIDMEPMVMIMAQIGREMEGKKGPVTAAEIAKAKAEFRKSSKKSESPAQDDPRESIERELPEGVKLLDFKATEKEFGVVTDMKFGFERLSDLVGVRLPSKEGGDPTQKNVIDSPFQGLEITEEGKTITIQTRPQNPAEKVEEQMSEGGPKIDPATEKMMRDAFAKMRIAYRITSPFTIVSHNATRKEGNTLIWEYDFRKIEELSKKDLDDLGVKVVYRR